MSFKNKKLFFPADWSSVIQVIPFKCHRFSDIKLA